VEINKRVDVAFSTKTGESLFREHTASERLFRTAHRFQAARPSGLEALAKDLNSLIVERIKTDVLRRYATPPKGENWGSLKWLQYSLASAVRQDTAKALMSPFFGVYELRISASHIGGPDRNAALEKAKIDSSAHDVEQGRQLLEAVVKALEGIVTAIDKLP
jgi:hypothetical protein